MSNTLLRIWHVTFTFIDKNARMAQWLKWSPHRYPFVLVRVLYARSMDAYEVSCDIEYIPSATVVKKKL